MYKTLYFVLFCNLSLFSQEVSISGKITDNQNIGILSASVLIYDINEKLLTYSYSNDKGQYKLVYENNNDEFIKLKISCLGYEKRVIKVEINSDKNIIQNFILKEKTETLNEVILDANQKIKINRDTTFIKVSSFGNKTEQTVEDILKKLPGIEVTKDGSIKAHGTFIDKLLIEGEDLFDNNYKLLSNNLDAKVLDEVQIIDNFEDNPIFKKLSYSDKVAINLKLKKDKTNIWFGNITIGSGVISENRWKESVNLGLLKKKIKLFYLGDYNNLGEKANDQIATNIIKKNTFGDDRYEYKSKSLFNISSNEIPSLSKSQSIFNTAFLNSLSFTTKIKSNLTLRALIYLADDKQTQNSFSETIYNLENNPISFTENKYYTNHKTLASSEIELKYFANENNYFTNLFIFKNNPSNLIDNLNYNSNQIQQLSKTKNLTFYNHFNHTLSLSSNKILNNYFYFGNDNIKENSSIISPLLNNYFDTNSTDKINQIANNSILYVGGKNKLIYNLKNIIFTSAIHYEFNKEIFKNIFLIKNNSNSEYENNTKINHFKFSFENSLKYNISKKIYFTSNITLSKNNLIINSIKNNAFLVNPSVALNIKKTGFGSFSLSLSENNILPKINLLSDKFQLINYRNFIKGTNYTKPEKNNKILFNYYLFHDKKRFSINTNLFYIKSKTIFNTENTITDNFNFSNYKLTEGGESYNFNFRLVNYLKKTKLATKIEIAQIWNSMPLKINNNDLISLKGYSNILNFSTTTYFKLPFNIDFGFNYNYNQSKFKKLKTKNITKDLFLNINYKISKVLLVETNNTMYFIDKQKYSFNNIIINHNPIESKFSYRLILNNVANESSYKSITLDNYTSYKSNIKLVPRYLLFTVKYRF